MANTLRVALRSRDAEIRFWAAVVLASNLSVVATCFSYITFVTPIGLQFWLLSAVVHAADVLLLPRAVECYVRDKRLYQEPSPG